MNTGDWTAIGAIATAAMAIATFILALKTRSMATATENMVAETKSVSQATLKEAQAVELQTQHIERQVKISSDALKSSVQPWLMWVPSYQDVGPNSAGVRGGMKVSIPDTFVRENGNDIIGGFVIRNIGTGIALVSLHQSFIFNVHNSDIPIKDIYPFMESPVIPCGEEARVKFTIPGTRGSNQMKMPLVELVGGGGSETMYVELAYSDVFGAIPTKVKFQLYRETSPGITSEPWRVIETTYRQDGRESIVIRSV